jgi:hypothetical protein
MASFFFLLSTAVIILIAILDFLLARFRLVSIACFREEKVFIDFGLEVSIEFLGFDPCNSQELCWLELFGGSLVGFIVLVLLIILGVFFFD